MPTEMLGDPALIDHTSHAIRGETEEAALTGASRDPAVLPALRDLFGKLEWDRSDDYKSGRSRD